MKDKTTNPIPVKLKKYSLDGLKAEGKQYYRKTEGCPGLFVRVIPSGVKTWTFVYLVDGQKRYMSLGNYPDAGIEEAKEKYEAARKLWKQGKDPAAIERQEKEEALNALTVASLVERYIGRHAKVFKRSWKEDDRVLKKDVIPRWGKRKAEDIRKRDVVELLEQIIDRGAPGSANNTYQIIRKMFSYAVEKGLLENTPCFKLKLPAPKNERDRTLNDEEIKTFWKKLNDPSLTMAKNTRRALKLLLVTGQRPGEVAGISKKEIDGRWWTIPVARQKVPREKESKRSPHRVCLTDLALELIGDMTVKNKKTGETRQLDFAFPCPHQKKVKPIDDHALAVAVRRNFFSSTVADAGNVELGRDGKPAAKSLWDIDLFTPHDLRRTMSTHLAELGIADDVNDAVLNHVKLGIRKTYNRYKYDPEKQVAMEAWEGKLRTLINSIGAEEAPDAPLASPPLEKERAGFKMEATEK